MARGARCPHWPFAAFMVSFVVSALATRVPFATAGIQHGLTATGHGTERRAKTWSVDYGANVNYFLEDAWSLGVAWAGHQERKFGYDRRDSFSLGVTYQFAGWLTAPAVFAPMRLAPLVN